MAQDYAEADAADQLVKYPKSWDVRDISGVNFATIDKNQHIPTYCGSCWAQAVTSALSDRINMRRNNVFPKTVVAAQALVNCVSANETNGCRGGDPTAANSWMQVCLARRPTHRNHTSSPPRAREATGGNAGKEGQEVEERE